MAVITNDGAVVFSLVSIYDCIAPGNLPGQSTSAQLRPILTPHVLKLTPDIQCWERSGSYPGYKEIFHFSVMFLGGGFCCTTAF